MRTGAEQKLADGFGLDDEQLEWARWKRKARKKLFPQEYPSTSAEAFLTSGNPYFDRDFLMDLARQLADPAFNPLTEVEIPAAKYPKLAAARTHVFQHDVKGRETVGEMQALSIWETPIAGRQYVISADTAEGINDRGDHDFDSADVFDAETWTQVAHLHGRWDTHEYGLILAQLGFWYNTALLGVERNNHGHAVINAILYTANYPEARSGMASGLYFHQEYDEKKNPTAMRPGWPVSAQSKFFALDGLATSLTDRDIHLRSRLTVSQLMNYVKKPGGKPAVKAAVTTTASALSPLRMRSSRCAPRGGWAQDTALLDWLTKR